MFTIEARSIYSKAETYFNADTHYSLGLAFIMMGDKDSAFGKFVILRLLDQHLANERLTRYTNKFPE